MKKIGFLSFGTGRPRRTRRPARQAMRCCNRSTSRSRAEELGADGAYFRVHHFARQLASPFPLLAAVRRKDQADRDRHRVHRHALRKPALHGGRRGAADLISGGRLQLGISRGSPEQVIDGYRTSAMCPPMARPMPTWRAPCRGVSSTCCVVLASPAQSATDVSQPAGPPPHRAPFRGPARTASGGAGDHGHGAVDRHAGHEPPSSTLVMAESTSRSTSSRPSRSVPIARPEGRRPQAHAARLGVRSIFALVNDMDRAYFGGDRNAADQFGYIEPGKQAVFGRSYAAEPDVLIRNWPRTRRSRKPTPCCSRCPTSSASPTTPMSSRRSSHMWRQGWAGAEAAAARQHRILPI